MTICIFKHLKYRYSKFKWNKLTSLKCFSPQFIHLILAGFIATNLIFSRDYFLNKLNVSWKKKGQNEDKATASSCLMLATALWWRWIVHRPVVQTKKIEEFLGTYSYRASCRSVWVPCFWLACDWLQHLKTFIPSSMMIHGYAYSEMTSRRVVKMSTAIVV